MATDKQLKFYRKNVAPSAPAAGAVWFDTVQKTINIYTGSAWEPYAGQLHDASWDANNQKLVIEKYDGSKIELSFSDVASASQMAVELGKKLNIGSNSDAAGTQSYYGLKKDIEVAKTALIGESLETATPDDDTIYGAKAYADNAVSVATEENVALFAAATTEINEKSEGHITVTKSKGSDNQAVYTIAENDIASAQDLSGVDKRVENIEKLISEDGNDTINNLTEVIAYFKDVKETETGAGLISTVAGHTTNIADVNKRIDSIAVDLSEGIAYVNTITVNGKALENNPVLNGDDIKLDGYATGTAAALEATDTINTALGKLEARVDAAAAGGVQSVGGKSGAITLDTDAKGNGNVKFAISETGEISATVDVGVQQVQLGQDPGTLMVDGNEFSLGLGSAAFTDLDIYATAAQGRKADSAVQSASGDDYVSASVSDNNVAVVANMQEMASASATSKGLAEASDVKSYVDNALCWVEF